MNDYLAYFCQAQPIADLNAVNSDHYLDLQDTTPNRQIGVGKPLYIEVTATAATDLSAGTLTMSLYTHTAALTTVTGTQLLSITGITMPNVTSKLMWQIPLPLTGLLRYIGLVFGAVTTNPASNLNVSAYLTETPQAWTAYNSALTVV